MSSQPSIKNIRVAFSRPKSKWAIGSLLIRWMDGAEFSHALLRWRSESIDRDLVYQASHSMVHFIEGKRFDQGADTIREYELSLTESQYNKAIQKCVDLAGTKYGTLTLLGIAFERITGIENPFRDREHSFICSELVGEIIKLCGGTVDMDLELAGPKQLEICVAALPGVVRLK